jgi:hypothetical protein
LNRERLSIVGFAGALMLVILLPVFVLGLPWRQSDTDGISRRMRQQLTSWILPAPALIVFDERMEKEKYHFMVDALVHTTGAPIVVFTSPGTAHALRVAGAGDDLPIIELSYDDRERLLSGVHFRILRPPCDRYSYRTMVFDPEFSFQTNFLAVLTGSSPLEQAETDQAVR